MESIRDQLLDLFARYANDDAQLIEELHKLIAVKGIEVCSFISQILANLELKPVEAERHWQQIVANRSNLNGALGRDVSLRTAACDYFTSVDRQLQNPKIVEIGLFENTVKSSTFDHLTGLLNRHAFDEALKREIARAKRYDTDLSLLFLDIDDFKKVNDSLGHLAGDEVLKKVASIIMAEKRAEDIAARFGGEEITILLPETGKADAWMIGERIRKKIAALVLDYEGNRFSITLSGGLASFPIDAGNDLVLIKHADMAMYRAKSFGKNNIAFYSMDKRKNIRVKYQTDVAIQELGIHGKPIHSAATKSLSLGGALLESPHLFEAGAKIQININLDGESPLIIIGTVIRAREVTRNSHEISIAFLDSNKLLKNELSTYLIKHLDELQPRTAEILHPYQ